MIELVLFAFRKGITMEQLISILKEENKGRKYVEYQMTADEYDLINYFYSIELEDQRSNEMKKILKAFKDEKIINMEQIYYLSQKINVYERMDLVDMIKGYLSCFHIEKSFEMEESLLSRFQRSMMNSNIASKQDIEDLEVSIQAAKFNTNVLNKVSIDLEKVQTRELLEKDIINPVIYEIPAQKQKRTS